MKKFCLAVFITSALSLSSALPSAAEDSDGVGKKLITIPLRTAGCFWALMVGTPIAITRLSRQRYRVYMDDVADMEGSSNGGVVYALPMGIGEGFASGLYYGPKNALANFDKPFSKESVSLGTLGPQKNP